MDLHRIVSGAIGSVNPFVMVGVRVSTGYTTAASGKRTPAYATPGAIVGAIAGAVLTVTAQTAGKLLIGQELAGAGVAARTAILSQLTGTPGGVGTYQVRSSADVASVAMTTSRTASAQIQPIGWRDLQQLEGLNLQGTRNAIYFNGAVDGIVRPQNKGGDLVTFPNGSIWLVAMVIESWPDWCKVAATLQDNQ